MPKVEYYALEGSRRERPKLGQDRNVKIVQKKVTSEINTKAWNNVNWNGS